MTKPGDYDTHMRLIKCRPGVTPNKFSTNHHMGYAGPDMDSVAGMRDAISRILGKDLDNWYVIQYPPGEYSPPARERAQNFMDRTRWKALI